MCIIVTERMHCIQGNMDGFRIKCFKYIVMVFFIPVLIWLIFCGVISTTEITRGGDIFFLQDSIMRNTIVLVLAILILLVCYRLFLRNAFITNIISKLNTRKFNELRRIILLCTFVIGMIWILASRTGGRADDRVIQEIAGKVLLGDYSDFANGGYIQRYPNQLGYLVYSVLISLIFGYKNYIVHQIFNVLAITFMYREMTLILERWKVSYSKILIYQLTAFLFCPLIMYCSYVYGTIMGLYFAVLAIRLEYDFFLDSENKIAKAILSSLAISTACLFKNNYLIFGIGMLIYAVFKLITLMNRKSVILVSIMLFSLVTILKIPSMTGLGGQASSVWVAMGLSDGDRGPGCYDPLCNTMFSADPGDKTIQSNLANEYISQKINEFSRNPIEAIEFFTRKNAGQWNCPTFEAYWINTYCDNDFERSELFYKLISADVEYYLLRFLDYFQLLCLIGVLFFVIFFWKDENVLDYLLFPTIFVGGFIFHTFWEANARYTLPYFALLIPLSVLGYGRFLKNVIGFSIEKMRLKNISFSSICLVISVTVIGIIYSITGIECITSDDESYRKDLAANTCRHLLSDGEYHFSTYDGRSIEIEGNGEWSIHNRLDKVILYLNGKGYLTYDKDSDTGESNFTFSPSIDMSESQRWSYQEGPYETLLLYNDDGYLSYDDGAFSVNSYTENPSELWVCN